MPPVVSIVGKSNSGKTTVVVKLIRELLSRSYRVATVKHVPQETVFDTPEKDSWRHIRAGSLATVISSRDKLVQIRPVAKEPSLEEITRFIGDEFDVVLAEGFKESDVPKIEVHRREIGLPLPSVKKLIAYVTDEPMETDIRQFSFADIKPLADLIETEIIKHRPGREV